MSNQSLDANIQACFSKINIEYKKGYYQIYDGASAISKHKDLSEAQWIKSILERDKLKPQLL